MSIYDDQKEKTGCLNSVISKINVFDSTEKAVKEIIALANGREDPIVLSFVNAHAINLAVRDKQFNEALLNSDVVLRDGVGIELMMNVLGLNSGENLNGTDFIPKIMSEYGRRKAKIMLFGTEKVWLNKAKLRLEMIGLSVVACHDGFQKEEYYRLVAERDVCDVIIMGMGMPKQELVSQYLKSKLNYPCLIINGGAILDFLGEKVSRSPSFFRYLRCEWVYRLMQEPRRLWRRYILGGFVFLNYVFLMKIVGKKNKS